MTARGGHYEDESAEERLGTRIDQYRLEAVLGAGGVGTVFAARDSSGGERTRVALKILRPELMHKTAMRVRFAREAELAQKLAHPAIVPVLSSGTTYDGAPYLVAELVDGATLEECRVERGGTLPLELVARVGDTLLDALAHAHAQGIVHRDIKPANVMLAADDAVRVLDFGLARVLEEDLAHGVTSADAVVGTAGYMAPEQAQGRWDLIDARTDLWAVGAMLYKLATGRDVHEAQTVQESLALAATKPVTSLAAPLPAAWSRLLLRALAFRREERFPNAAAFRAALADVAKGAPGPPLVSGVRPVMRARRTMISLAAAGVLLVSAGALVLSQRPHAQSVLSTSTVEPVRPVDTETAIRPADSEAPAATIHPLVPPTAPTSRRQLRVLGSASAAASASATVAAAQSMQTAPTAVPSPSAEGNPLDVRR